MLVVIIHFPPIREGKKGEFLKWFASSNEEFAKHEGFLGRRLLEPVGGGNYVAVMEHASRETFAAVQRAPGHEEASRQVSALLDGQPNLWQYEVVALPGPAA
jgi:heme-degrading monooxygenase HmoA